MPRSNWLATLSEYVEETESPRHFWTWAGIFTISSALQRKVWLPFGMEPLFPNLYVMIIAPPGRCRKGPPLSFSKKILKEIQSPVFVDSPTKRALTEELAALSQKCHFQMREQGVLVTKPQAPLALISKELSSFLAVDPKNMIEVLTDLYDSYDEWDYKTSKAGEDKIRCLCIGCLFATTPSWIAANLPEEAIGGGFTSRFVLVTGTDKYKYVPIPPPLDPGLHRRLAVDLAHISRLVGEFKWSSKGEEFYREWYLGIEDKVKETKDDRLHGYLERIHIMALKTAMCLHVASEDSLILEVDDIGRAVDLLEDILKTASGAFTALGRSATAIDTERIRGQLAVEGSILFSKLLTRNYHHTDKEELTRVLDNLEAMKQIHRSWTAGGEQEIKYTGKEEEKCKDI